jgi:methanogenic corrinoid protein MtbC1
LDHGINGPEQVYIEETFRMSGRDILFQQYMDPLLRGQRATCRQLVLEALERGHAARELYRDLLFPAMERVDQLYREDRINCAEEHMAARINRTVADHLQSRLERRPSIARKIVIACAEGEPEELSAQMFADLFEADGWDVYLLGGGVPQDEVGALVGRLQPDLLLVFGSRPSDAPLVRRMIDYIREIQAAPMMNVMVSGGVFNRASGLWREVKADLFAETACEALEVASAAMPRAYEPRAAGMGKKRRRRRKPPLLSELEQNEAVGSGLRQSMSCVAGTAGPA